MIIQALQAQNFRQFLHLNIQLIPANGVIAIVGGNETGKSAIGEAITFALFGVTDQVPGKASYKLVRWGQEEAIVQVALQINDKPLLIERTITAAGHMTIVMWDRLTGQVMADNAKRVQAILQNLLGYGYKVFSQTFYWSQQLAESNTADLESIRAMAGVQIYQQAQELVDHDASITVLKSERIEKTVKDQQTQLTDLKIDPLRLPWLQETRAELLGAQQQHVALSEQIAEESQAYEQRYPLFKKLKRKVNRSLWMAGALLIGMVALVVLAGLSIEYPEWIKTSLAQYSNPVIWGALLLGLAAGGVLFWAYRLSTREVNPLLSKAGLLAQRVYAGYRIMSTPLYQLLHPATVDWFKEKRIPAESPDILMEMKALSKWSPQVESYTIKPPDLHEITDGLSVNLQRRHQVLGTLVSQIDEDIRREQSKAQDIQKTQQQQSESQTQLKAVQGQLQMQLVAQGLIKRAQQQAAQRFNSAISLSTRPLIELMTQGQYQAVELADDLILYALYAGGRTPFQLLSVEHQRLIAIALHLNLAKVFAKAQGTPFQFMFWDGVLTTFAEPLLSQTLADFRQLLASPLTQLWITLPYMPQEVQGLVIVDCRSGDDVLDVKAVQVG